MNALNIFMVIFVIGVYFDTLRAQKIPPTNTSTLLICKPPPPACYRNRANQCRTFDSPCEAALNDCKNSVLKLNWQVTDSANCLFRAPNEVKVCYLDCAIPKNCADMPNKPACGVDGDVCKKFSNVCYLQQDSCMSAILTVSWRIGEISKCDGLSMNGPAGLCKY